MENQQYLEANNSQHKKDILPEPEREIDNRLEKENVKQPVTIGTQITNKCRKRRTKCKASITHQLLRSYRAPIYQNINKTTGRHNRINSNQQQAKQSVFARTPKSNTLP